LLENSIIARIYEWRAIVLLDAELDLIGLNDVNNLEESIEDEELLRVVLIGPGDVRVSARQEEE
jgi:hypothetical protein